MIEKTKMYTTILFAWLIPLFLIFSIYTSNIGSENIWSTDIDELKKRLLSDELSSLTNVDEGSQWVNTLTERDQNTELDIVDIPLNDDPWLLPVSVNLDVTFFPQAPDADWSLPWKEACEESSIVQAYYFIQWKELTKDIFKSEILSLVETQNDIFWQYIDTSISETAEFLEAQYWYTNYEIIDKPSVEEMKRELALGHPIIAPFAWKQLWNIYFSDGGPRYHALVIVWYDETWFITNDVGTSRGKNYPYSYDILMDALHDLVPLWEWDIWNGAKRILVMR